MEIAWPRDRGGKPFAYTERRARVEREGGRIGRDGMRSAREACGRPSRRSPMTNLDILGAARDKSGGYKVDVSRGERIGRVSSEWFSRPADERYLSLSELFAAVRGRAEQSRTRTVESAAIRVEANRDDAERLTVDP